MKKITILTIFMSYVIGFSQNQSNGTIGGPTIAPASAILANSGNPIATERFRFGSGLITQLDSGADFDFTPSSQWLSFGRLTSPNQTLYGYRAQRAGRGLIFGFSGAPQSTTPTLGTPVIEWVGNGTATAGDLIFRTSPSSTSTVSTQVMRLKENSDILMGRNSVFDNIFSNPFSSFNPNPSKVEINEDSNDRKTSLNIFRQGNFPVTNTPFLDSRTALNVNLLNTNNIASGSNYVGISSIVKSPKGNAIGLGVDSQLTDNGTRSVGINVNASGGRLSYGIDIISNIGGNATFNYGINTVSTAFLGTVANSNYGVYAQANGNNVAGSINYAFYGSAAGINNFAGYFNGRIFSTNALVVSDKTLKKDVKIEENVIERISKLKPVTYNFIEDKKATGLNLSDRLQHGFIAQELEEVFPELVEEILNPIFNEKNEQIGTKTLKAVNYIGLISVLTSSINEMSKKIETLEEKLNSKEPTLVVNSSKEVSSDDILKIVKNSYSLAQNVPNPFNNTTTISYSLPENERNASIMIFNLNGQLIKSYNLNEQKGELVINANDLQKGMYLYSLISNNEEIITKRMIIN